MNTIMSIYTRLVIKTVISYQHSWSNTDAKVDVSTATIHPKKVALLGARVRYMDHNHQYICGKDRLSFVLPRSNRLLALGMVYSYPFVRHVPCKSLFNRRKNYPIGLIKHAISTGNCFLLEF